MRTARSVACALAVGLLGPWVQPAISPSSAVRAADISLTERVAVQEQRIAELEEALSLRQQPFQVRPAVWSYETVARRLEALEAAVEQTQKGPGPGYGKQQWLDSHDQKWMSAWGGRIFFDYANFAKQNVDSVRYFGDAEDYGEFRSLRLFTEGVGYGVFGYRLELDLAPELGSFDDPAVRVKDAYVGIRDVPWAGTVVLGNQKVPFGLDALTRHEFTTFMERAKPVERAVFYSTFGDLGPTDGDVALRRVGIAVYNHSDCPRWAYQAGVFFEDVDPLMKERVSDEQGFEFAVRGVWIPLFANDGRQLLHVGGGFDYVDDADDQVLWAYRPEVHEAPIMNAGVATPCDDYVRANLEGALVLGPASVQTELFAFRTRDPGLDYYGAYIQASFFLTGENRGYDPTLGVFHRVTPLENFWIVSTSEGRCLGTGAWEAAIRWSYVDTSDAATTPISGTENDITLGLNWYWNPYARMMFNYIHSRDSYSAGGKPELDILALRWQVDW